MSHLAAFESALLPSFSSYYHGWNEEKNGSEKIKQKEGGGACCDPLLSTPHTVDNRGKNNSSHISGSRPSHIPSNKLQFLK
jgi:hypothetical protein